MPWSSFSECWVLSQLFHYSFTFTKRLFISSSLSAIRVVSSAYLRLLIFLLAILIPACVSPSQAFLMMYSAYKLNKQGDNIQPWHSPFPIWNQSVVPCPVLTVASWPAYRFLKRQIYEYQFPHLRNEDDKPYLPHMVVMKFMWDEYNCAVVWAFFGIAFLWDWNENWLFLVLWPLLSFPNLLAYWVQHFHSIIF